MNTDISIYGIPDADIIKSADMMSNYIANNYYELRNSYEWYLLTAAQKKEIETNFINIIAKCLMAKRAAETALKEKNKPKKIPPKSNSGWNMPKF